MSRLDDEIREHLDRLAAEHVARGLSPEDARAAARRDFGRETAVREAHRAQRGWTWLEQWGQDLRAGLRIVTKAPGLTATAVALVALVVGGNATVFSIAHGIISRPAPGIGASSLVTLTWIRDDGFVEPGTSYANYLDIAAQTPSLPAAMAYRYDRSAVGDDLGTHAVWNAAVSANYFDVLGVAVARGRGFTAADDEGTDGVVAVISDRAWRDFFQRRADIVGHPIVLNGRPVTIVGVAAAPFRGTQLAPSVDLWVPLASSTRAAGRQADLASRDDIGVSVIARLAPKASLEQARTELSGVWRRLQRGYPDVRRNLSATLVEYSGTAGGNSVVALGGNIFLAIFSVITSLTLIIVCANVANLLLGRAVVRQRELALRQSLGASRGRIVRLLLAEGLAISILACAAACACAWWVGRSLSVLVAPTTNGNVNPLAPTVGFDWTVAGYAMLLALIATVAFTVAPALRAWRQPLLPWLKAGEQGVVQGRSRVSSGLVVLQLAFSVLLVTSGGLAYRSVQLLGNLDLRYDPSRILLVTVNTAGSASDPGSHHALAERIVERLSTLNGVETVSYARTPPREIWRSADVRAITAAEPIAAEQNFVGPRFLEAYGLSPLRGRELDREAGRTLPSVVINRGLAAALWPRQDAIGRRLLVGNGRSEAEVVGVAPDAFFGGFRRTRLPHHVLFAEPQAPGAPGEITFFIRHNGEAASLGPDITRSLRELDARVPVVFVRGMTMQLEGIIWPIRMMTILLAVFAGGSLLIAIIGQYAVVAFDTRRRVREFGVRIAVGASARQVLVSVLREGLRLTAIGLGVGFVLSLVVGFALRGLLYGVTPTDPVTYGYIFTLLVFASLAACLLPAARASAIDPIKALRFE